MFKAPNGHIGDYLIYADKSSYPKDAGGECASLKHNNNALGNSMTENWKATTKERSPGQANNYTQFRLFPYSNISIKLKCKLQIDSLNFVYNGFVFLDSGNR